MSEELLFPELGKIRSDEAQELLKKFEDKIIEIAKDILSDFYVQYVPHIESDAWANMRQHVLNELKNYSQCKNIYYDYREIRKQILKEFRSEIIDDLNKDHLQKINSLEQLLENSYLIRRNKDEMIHEDCIKPLEKELHD